MNKVIFVLGSGFVLDHFYYEQVKKVSAIPNFKVHVIINESYPVNFSGLDNIEIHYVNFTRGISLLIIKNIIDLIILFRQLKPNYIKYSTPNASFAASVAGYIARIENRVYHIMGIRLQSQKKLKKLLLWIIEWITIKTSTEVDCVSKSVLMELIKLKLRSNNKLYVLGEGSTNGVDLNKFNVLKKNEMRKHIRNLFSIKDTDFVFMFIGRITKDKGIFDLIKVFKNRFSVTSDYLFIIGPTEEVDIKSYNQQNIIMLDYTKNISEYLAAADLLVLPSYREGLGNVILEAAAMKVASVGSNVVGISDAIIDYETGLLFELKNLDDLHRKMLLMKTDFDLRTRLAENAYDRVKSKFESTTVIDRIVDNIKSKFEINIKDNSR